MQTYQTVHSPFPIPDPQPAARHVIACVDRSGYAEKIVPHALAVAGALRRPITLLQVLEAHPGSDPRPDPIEWDIRRREARGTLERLAELCSEGEEVVATELTEGQTPEEICRWASDQAAELIVLGTQGEGRGARQRLGRTARSVLERAQGSVLLVPVTAPAPFADRYRRILVPVDGSSWAESVLPLATQLASTAKAELIVAHIVPVPELTGTAPLEADDIALRERIVERNERVARTYVERLRSHASEKGLKVRTVIRRGEDVRTSLTDLIAAEGIELVVLSARGQGRHRPSDIPYGDVAAYLMTHSPVPMLIVRPARTAARPVAPFAARNARMPARAAQ